MKNLEDINKTTMNEGKVMVDFFAEWCNPCKNMMPIVEKLEEKYGDKISFMKCNVDTTELHRDFNIKNIPCFLFLDNGKVENRISGTHTEEQMEEYIKLFLNEK